MKKVRFLYDTSYFIDDDVKVRFERNEVVDALLSFFQDDDLMVLVRKSDELAPVVIYFKDVETLQENSGITDVNVL